MVFHFENGLNLCVLLLLIFEVLVLLITSSHYVDDHSSFESNHTHILAKYQQQRQMNAAILGLKSISVLPPKNFKSKFLHSVLKYTTNGVSIFNPLILQLEIFKAWDVNPNPGPRGNKKDKINELCPRISLPGNGLKLGQWKVNNLTDSKLEQTRLLLTANQHEIDVLFLIETLTFLKPNKPDWVLQIPQATRFSEKTDKDRRKGVEVLLMSLTDLR